MAGAGDARAEDGFALVAALAAALMFSLLAYTVLAADRGALADVEAQLRRARMEAAADGALATAVAGLAAPINRRWEIDRRRRTVMVGGVQVDVVVEDERGKAPLNNLRPDQVRRLFQTAGVSGARLDQLTDNVLDWLDGGIRPDGAKGIDYAADGIRSRDGPFRTIDELMIVKGMDQAIFERIAPDLTVFFGVGGPFDRTTASPLALTVMSPAAAADRSTKASAQRPALSAPAADDYLGRPFTVRIAAHDAAGGELRRAYVVELTGQPRQPFWTRAVD
jgi:general secretion pathway protein K